MRIVNFFGNLEQHDRADGLSALHEIEGIVDFRKRHCVRYQGIDLDFAVHVPIDDFGNIAPALCSSEGGASPDAPCDELEGSGSYFCACGRDPDDDALAPSFVAAFEGLAHRRRIADALEGVVCSAFGEGGEVGYEIVVFAELIRIDEVCHTELFAERFFLRIGIDSDDHRCAYEACALHDIESDASQAEDDDMRSWLDLGGIDDGTDTCRHAAPDVADFVEGRVLANFGEGYFGNDGVFGEGRSSHIMEQCFAVEREPRGSVGHDSFPLGCSDGLAEVSFS